MKHRVYKEKEITCPCGKVGYKSKRKAEAAIRLIQNNSHSERYRAYYCKECHKWHITSCHIIGENLIKKPFCQYNRLDKKAQDREILMAYGIA